MKLWPTGDQETEKCGILVHDLVKLFRVAKIHRKGIQAIEFPCMLNRQSEVQFSLPVIFMPMRPLPAFFHLTQ